MCLYCIFCLWWLPLDYKFFGRLLEAFVYHLLLISLILTLQVKDQTYFLSHLSQTQLKRLIFPLGGISKVHFNTYCSAESLFAFVLLKLIVIPPPFLIIWRMKFAILLHNLIYLTRTERIHKEYVFLGRYLLWEVFQPPGSLSEIFNFLFLLNIFIAWHYACIFPDSVLQA